MAFYKEREVTYHGKRFFGSLGETLTKTAKELSGRAEEVYETQRLKNKISGEERQIEKAMADLGRIIYKRYKKEIPVDDAQKALCEQIDQRMEQIEKYKTDISELKVKINVFVHPAEVRLQKMMRSVHSVAQHVRLLNRKKMPEMM